MLGHVHAITKSPGKKALKIYTNCVRDFEEAINYYLHVLRRDRSSEFFNNLLFSYYLFNLALDSIIFMDRIHFHTY